MIRLIREKTNNGSTELTFKIQDRENHSYTVNTIINKNIAQKTYEAVSEEFKFSISNNSDSSVNVGISIEENGTLIFYGRTKVKPYIEPTTHKTVKADLIISTEQINQKAMKLFG